MNRPLALLRLADQPNRAAFSDLLVKLANNPPPPIIGEADADDLEECAEHAQRLLTDIEAYFKRTLADMQRRTSGVNLDVNVLGILSDTRGDLVGTLRIAAEQMREIERERDDAEFC
jgi:hypothetical protein